MQFQYQVAVNPEHQSACPSIPADAQWSGSVASFVSSLSPSQLVASLPASEVAVLTSCSVLGRQADKGAVCLFEHYSGILLARLP